MKTTKTIIKWELKQKVNSVFFPRYKKYLLGLTKQLLETVGKKCPVA